MSSMVNRLKDADNKLAGLQSDEAPASEIADAKTKLDTIISKIKEEIKQLKDDSKTASLSDLEAIETTLQELEDALEVHGSSGGRRRKTRRGRKHRRAKKSRKSRK
jgi:uncharacterized phage infection (PIP) family protein YhgE